MLRDKLRLSSLWIAFSLTLGPVSVTRGQAISQGFELERQGRFEPAAALYAAVLRADAANVAALLGLERVLPSLGRLRELAPLMRQALAVDSGAALRGLAVRTYTVLGESDSAAAVARMGHRARGSAALRRSPGRPVGRASRARSIRRAGYRAG